MTTCDSSTTRLTEYIKELLPWAHGHQVKAIATFVAAIIAKQTGTQAALARSCGNQEAAVKRLSRLIHNERLRPHALAEAVLEQALRQLPRRGKVRLAIDWTIEGTQHLLVVSLITGGRAVPIYWRGYDQAVLKGRMRRYEMAVIKRVLRRVRRLIGGRRLRVTADRGFADVTLCDVLESFETIYLIRVKRSTKVYVGGAWQQLQTLRFLGNARGRRRRAGTVLREQSAPVVGEPESCAQRGGRVGSLGLALEQSAACWADGAGVWAALRLRAGLSGRQMAARLCPSARARDQGVVTLLRLLCAGVAGARDIGREAVVGGRATGTRLVAARGLTAAWAV